MDGKDVAETGALAIPGIDPDHDLASLGPFALIDRQALEHLPPSAKSRLLHFALAEHSIAEPRRVFTNRNLHLDSIRHVGFDLDWTLAEYDHAPMDQLAFELTLERLVTGFGYPKRIYDAELRPKFIRRGLILDTEQGTILKMNRHRFVGRAFFGRHQLDDLERARLYRREPVRPSTKRYYFVDTLFELPELNVYSELVEMTRRSPKLEIESYAGLFRDVRAAIDSVHGDDTLKSRVLAELDRFLPRDPEVVTALERLRLGGRQIILITNSEPYYTDALCRHLFDDDQWRRHFDLVIASARKPGFFRNDGPFVELDDDLQPQGEVDVPAWGGFYTGGSRTGLMQLLDCLGEQVLYVGDHIYGDVVSTKLASTWRTALVIRELGDELGVLVADAPHLRRMAVLRAELDDLGRRLQESRDVLRLYRELAADGSLGDASQAAIRHADSHVTDLATEYRILRQHLRQQQQRLSDRLNPYWGSVFKQGGNKSLFGSQVDHFACVYTSKVANFAYYGTDHEFRVVRDPMMHEPVI
ncbi:MAG: HAD-IG family 5'-nucleotidase [Acidobacteriota bacterium]